eukprot:COSAG01_NODE_14920_length_1395_cov_2.047068_2_plen_116_part_00
MLQSHVRGEAARRDRQEEEVAVVFGPCGGVPQEEEVAGHRDMFNLDSCGVRPVLHDGETEDALFDRVDEWFQARWDLVWSSWKSSYMYGKKTKRAESWRRRRRTWCGTDGSRDIW